MITGHINRQRLNLCDSHVVADTIDYLEAKFDFRTPDWNGLDKWAHFAKDGAVYDIRLTDDCIRKEDHLNLSAGMWKVYLHGNEFRGGEVIQRITTDEVILYVIPTGTLDGEPFPTVPPSAGEQIIASAVAAEAGAKKAADSAEASAGTAAKSAEAAGKSAQTAEDAASAARKTAEEAEQTVRDTLQDAKDSGEFDGEKGDKGDPGENYNLTEADMAEIAELVPSGKVLVFVMGISLDNLHIWAVMPPPGVTLEAAYGLVSRGMFTVLLMTHDSDDINTGVGFLQGMSYGDDILAAGEFWTSEGCGVIQLMLDFSTETAEAEGWDYGISSGGGGGVVRLSDEPGAFVLSHTPAEIAEMAQTGAVVLMTENGDVLPLLQCDGEFAMFAGTLLSGDTLIAIQITVTAEGVDYGAQEYVVAEMTGATASTPGVGGTVPAPAAGQQNHVLHGDGTWRAVDNTSGAVRYDAAQELTDIQQTTARLNIGAAAGITADASGEVLALTDSADAPLRGLCVYGKSVQDGTPTPDTPVEIVSVGGDGVTEVQALGANLIPFPYYNKDGTRQGIKWTVNPDRSVTANGTATANSYFVLTSGIEWYTSGFNTVTGVKTLNGITFGYGLNYNTGNKQLFVAVKSGETVNNKTFYPMANYGKTILPYEPYTAQTLTISTPDGLCGIPVTSGGNYTDADGQMWVCDEVDFSRGVRVQRIGTTVLHGDESIDLPTGILSKHTPFRILSGFSDRMADTAMVCTHLVYMPGKYDNNNINFADVAYVMGYPGESVAAAKQLFLIIPFEIIPQNDIDALSSWLSDQYAAGTPVTIRYILAEPIETPLTADELAAYRALHMNYPNTTICADDNAGLTAAYAADTKNYIDRKFTELQNAILSTGGNV